MTATEASPLVEMSNEEYHAHPALSSTGAVAILNSPARFKYDRENPVHKDIFDFGTVAHSVILGDTTVDIRVIDADSWRTKAAKEARDNAREQGAAPILAADWKTIEALREAALTHPVANQLLTSDGPIEQSLFWGDPATGVECRARPDKLVWQGDQLVIVDYKTAVSADPEQFAKSAANYGYHQQAAWYIEAAQATGLHAEPAFIHIVQEKTAPYLVSVIQLDADALDTGHRLNQIARERFRDCTETNLWPGYGNEIHSLSLPGWYIHAIGRKHP